MFGRTVAAAGMAAAVASEPGGGAEKLWFEQDGEAGEVSLVDERKKQSELWNAVHVPA